MSATGPSHTLAQATDAAVAQALVGPGLLIDIGLATLRLRSDAASLAPQLRTVYAHFPLVTAGDWADLHVDLMRPRGLRRWWQPQAVFSSDGRAPFAPFPLSGALPLLEWGANWLIGRRFNDCLLLHAGAIERDGVGLLLPATPGSGKSTLSAALSLSGWRLLSDEFGVVDLTQGRLHAALKPVALKNESIDVIRRWSADALIGPSFPGTRKGTVAHLAATADAAARVHASAVAGAIVLPRWSPDGPTRFQRIGTEQAFRALAFNAFNYAVTGEDGFRTVARLARQCMAWELVYHDLADAVARLDEAWPEIVAAVAPGAEDRS